jgi:hypothetical protein
MPVWLKFRKEYRDVLSLVNTAVDLYPAHLMIWLQAILTDSFFDFPLSVYANVRIVPPVGHNCLFPNA